MTRLLAGIGPRMPRPGLALLGAGVSLVGGVLFAQEPQPGPDLTGYRTVREAATRAIEPPPAGHPGETGYLGVSLIRDGQGRLAVDEVQAGSPAARAGIEKGDLLTDLDGDPVRSPEAFRDSLQMRGPGRAVKLALIRGSDRIEKSATLSATSRPRALNGRRAYLGVVLGDAKEGEGVRIDEVSADSPAAGAGFKPGDRIFQIEGVDLANASKLTEILSEKRPGDEFEVSVRRGAEDVVLRPRLATEPDGAAAAGAPGAARGGQARGPVAIPLWTGPEFRLAVIGIEYPDIKHNAKVSADDWRDALLSEGTYHAKKDAGKEGPVESLNDYFVEQSAGAFRLKGKVFDWIEVGKKRSEYILGSGTTNINAVLTEALDKVAARDGKDAFKDFDGFLFLYAGEPIRGNRGGVYYPRAGMIRSFQSKRWPSSSRPRAGRARRRSAAGQGVRPDARPAGSRRPARESRLRGARPWCAMSNPTRGSRPQHFGAWSKEKLGWVKPIVIDPTVPQKLILAPIEGASGECVKILVRPDGSEYFLLENRRKSGFDEALPAEGLLIWRVVHDRPILEESHGVEGPTGPTAYPDSIPYPSPANHAFTAETIPSSRSPLGGGLPVSITNIRRLADGRISFEIGHEYR